MTARISSTATTVAGPFFMRLYDYAWFVGFFISFVVYWVLTTLVRRPQTEK